MSHSINIAWTPQLQARLLDGAVNFVAAVVILVVGWIVARALSNWLGRTLDRLPHIDATLRPLLVALVRYGIIAITIIAVLNRFGVQTTSLIAVLGAAGIAIGLAIQGTMANVASGVMLLVLRPFQVGDYITAGSTGGSVREIGLFRTVLITADLVFVSVPNSEIFGSAITNYSREPTRRINFTVGIDYSDDIEKAQALALEEMKKDKRILPAPEPMVPVGELGASSVDLIIRCWTSNSDYWNVLFDLQKAIKLRFDAEGVTIPFPQHVVTMRNTASIEAAVARENPTTS